MHESMPELSEWNRMELTTGLCSVTLRALPVPKVIEAAVHAGLAGIEWGADVHVTDSATAAVAAKATLDAGLLVLSLGSYYRAGSFADFRPTLESAVALGAPRIRVWAGGQGSAESDAQGWADVVTDTQRIAALADEHEIGIAFEYHGSTLTDSPDATLRLLSSVDRANVGTYWQPAVGLSDHDALASLNAVLPYLVGVHCFSWWPLEERLPLEGRKQLWHDATDVLRESGRSLDIMLEFVEQDSPDSLARDAEFLNMVALGED